MGTLVKTILVTRLVVKLVDGQKVVMEERRLERAQSLENFDVVYDPDGHKQYVRREW